MVFFAIQFIWNMFILLVIPLLNTFDACYPSTHVLRLIFNGELIQYLSVSGSTLLAVCVLYPYSGQRLDITPCGVTYAVVIGLLHRGTEKLMETNLTTSIIDLGSSFTSKILMVVGREKLFFCEHTAWTFGSAWTVGSGSLGSSGVCPLSLSSNLKVGHHTVRCDLRVFVELLSIRFHAMSVLLGRIRKKIFALLIRLHAMFVLLGRIRKLYFVGISSYYNITTGCAKLASPVFDYSRSRLFEIGVVLFDFYCGVVIKATKITLDACLWAHRLNLWFSAVEPRLKRCVSFIPLTLSTYASLSRGIRCQIQLSGSILLLTVVFDNICEACLHVGWQSQLGWTSHRSVWLTRYAFDFILFFSTISNFWSRLSWGCDNGSNSMESVAAHLRYPSLFLFESSSTKPSSFSSDACADNFVKQVNEINNYFLFLFLFCTSFIMTSTCYWLFFLTLTFTWQVILHALIITVLAYYLVPFILNIERISGWNVVICFFWNACRLVMIKKFFILYILFVSLLICFILIYYRKHSTVRVSKRKLFEIGLIMVLARFLGFSLSSVVFGGVSGNNVLCSVIKQLNRYRTSFIIACLPFFLSLFALFRKFVIRIIYSFNSSNLLTLAFVALVPASDSAEVGKLVCQVQLDANASPVYYLDSNKLACEHFWSKLLHTYTSSKAILDELFGDKLVYKFANTDIGTHLSKEGSIAIRLSDNQYCILHRHNLKSLKFTQGELKRLIDAILNKQMLDAFFIIKGATERVGNFNERNVYVRHGYELKFWKFGTSYESISTLDKFNQTRSFYNLLWYPTYGYFIGGICSMLFSFVSLPVGFSTLSQRIDDSLYFWHGIATKGVWHKVSFAIGLVAGAWMEASTRSETRNVNCYYHNLFKWFFWNVVWNGWLLAYSFYYVPDNQTIFVRSKYVLDFRVIHHLSDNAFRDMGYSSILMLRQLDLYRVSSWLINFGALHYWLFQSITSYFSYSYPSSSESRNVTTNDYLIKEIKGRGDKSSNSMEAVLAHFCYPSLIFDSIWTNLNKFKNNNVTSLLCVHTACSVCPLSLFWNSKVGHHTCSTSGVTYANCEHTACSVCPLSLSWNSKVGHHTSSFARQAAARAQRSTSGVIYAQQGNAFSHLMNSLIYRIENISLKSIFLCCFSITVVHGLIGFFCPFVFLGLSLKAIGTSMIIQFFILPRFDSKVFMNLLGFNWVRLLLYNYCFLLFILLIIIFLIFGGFLLISFSSRISNKCRIKLIKILIVAFLGKLFGVLSINIFLLIIFFDWYTILAISFVIFLLFLFYKAMYFIWNKVWYLSNNYRLNFNTHFQFSPSKFENENNSEIKRNVLRFTFMASSFIDPDGSINMKELLDTLADELNQENDLIDWHTVFRARYVLRDLDRVNEMFGNSSVYWENVNSNLLIRVGYSEVVVLEPFHLRQMSSTAFKKLLNIVNGGWDPLTIILQEWMSQKTIINSMLTAKNQGLTNFVDPESMKTIKFSDGSTRQITQKQYDMLISAFRLFGIPIIGYTLGSVFDYIAPVSNRVFFSRELQLLPGGFYSKAGLFLGAVIGGESERDALYRCAYRRYAFENAGYVQRSFSAIVHGSILMGFRAKSMDIDARILEDLRQQWTSQSQSQSQSEGSGDDEFEFVGQARRNAQITETLQAVMVRHKSTWMVDHGIGHLWLYRCTEALFSYRSVPYTMPSFKIIFD